MSAKAKAVSTLVGVIVVLVGVLIYVFGGMTHVGIGSVGIVKHMDGQVTEIPQGYHWTGWGVAVQSYPTYRQALNGADGVKLQVGTADQQELPVTTNLNWSIDIKQSEKLYQSVGGNNIQYISDTIVLPTMKNDINKVTHTYGWNDIKGAKQADITTQIEDMLRSDLAKSGIEVVNFGFSYVGSPAGMASSQQSLASSELATKKAQQIQDRAKIENETKIMNAEAQAKANKIIESSINSVLLQQQAIQKWNGQLPQVSGTNSTPFVNIK